MTRGSFETHTATHQVGKSRRQQSPQSPREKTMLNTHRHINYTLLVFLTGILQLNDWSNNDWIPAISCGVETFNLPFPFQLERGTTNYGRWPVAMEDDIEIEI